MAQLNMAEASQAREIVDASRVSIKKENITRYIKAPKKNFHIPMENAEPTFMGVVVICAKQLNENI